MTNAISGSRGPYRETADGSLEVKIIIDPRFKDDFHRLFKEKDMPVAITPLIADFEQKEKEKIGNLCLLAVQWCKEPQFYDFIRSAYDRYLDRYMDGMRDIELDRLDSDELICSYAIKVMCEIDSRRELDTDIYAAGRFHKLIREPYLEWLKGKK